MGRRFMHLGRLMDHDPLLKLISYELGVENANTLMEATL